MSRFTAQCAHGLRGSPASMATDSMTGSLASLASSLWIGCWIPADPMCSRCTRSSTLIHVGSVTASVSLVWRPARYAVRWAYTPADVPAFDPSRGGDPFAVEVFGFRARDLGGGQDPPDLEWVSDASLNGGEDVIPITGSNYPRLVRVSETDLGEVQGRNDPLKHLAALARHEDKLDFMEEASMVAATYGPLSFAQMDSSLEAWRQRAMEMRSHLGLLEQMDRLREVKEATEAEISLDADDRQLLVGELGSLNTELAEVAPERILALIRDSATLLEVRDRLVDLYWEAFGHQLRPYGHPDAYFATTKTASTARKLLVDVGSAPGQIVVRCGSLGWSLQELWSKARRAKPIRQCKNCGRIFEPVRRDAEYCSGRCRVASHRRRLRLAD